MLDRFDRYLKFISLISAKMNAETVQQHLLAVVNQFPVSAQDRITVLGKAHMGFTLSVSNLPKLIFETERCIVCEGYGCASCVEV